ncbi:Urease accessory protein UreF [hydrothermal vent metagenome]|uniref:Urease accessory protein UreF n=1 Tax=hydrothermal vent metagenome TaxID=652676 RepID=A0A3B1BNY9_9ZZZZ
MPDVALPGLRLLQLFSPNLPTGAFTYSQGMEWAVECAWLKNEKDTYDWLQSVFKDSLQYLELPLLIRLYAAFKNRDYDSVSHWSQRLYASRETRELRDEEKQRARALFNVLKKLPDAQCWPELKSCHAALLNSQLAGYALAAYHWQIGLSELLNSYCWSWLENAVAVAIKLVPLGQTQGQRLLYELSAEIAALVACAQVLEDAAIGASTPALAIASSLHETQYSRLFRS